MVQLLFQAIFFYTRDPWFKRGIIHRENYNRFYTQHAEAVSGANERADQKEL